MADAERSPQQPVYPYPPALELWTRGHITVDLGRLYGPIDLRDLPTGFGGRSETVKENRSKAGILNHFLLVDRMTAHSLRQIQPQCPAADPELGYSLHLISHLGTIPASEFKKRTKSGAIAVDDPTIYEHLPVEYIGQAIVRTSRAPAVLKHSLASFSSIGRSMDEKNPPTINDFVAHYWDHRITDRMMPLGERLAGFVLGNHVDPQAGEGQKEKLKQAVIDLLAASKKAIVSPQNSLDSTFSFAANTDELVDAMVGSLKQDFGDVIILSSRGTSLAHIVTLWVIDVQTEAYLERLGVDTQRNRLPPMPAREWYLRLLFIDRATPKIFQEVHRRQREHPEQTVDDILRQMFPSDNPSSAWWDDSMREKFVRYAGRHPKKRWKDHKGADRRRLRGPRRGVIFFSQLRQNRDAKILV